VLDQGVARAVDTDDDQLAGWIFRVGKRLQKISQSRAHGIVQDMKVVDDHGAESPAC
jgi:hypothetical protein